jgi:predicted Zn-dependent peptidase
MTTVHEIMGYRIVLNKTNVKRISVESAINAGFLNETRETSGINHLLEHVLTESWTKCGASCSEYWSKKGVRMNASTDETIMMYYVKGLVDDLESMVNYIAAITDHPILRKESIDKEKQAVIDELLTYGSDPTSKLDGVFNHVFYKNGLEFKDDWKLQIQNLKKLSLHDLQTIYKKEFTPANTVFVVSGAFSPNVVLRHFRNALRPTNSGVRIRAEGFTHKHEIRYVHDSMATSFVVLAMPSAVYSDSILIPLATAVLEDVLFDELRTKRQLVYGVKVVADTTTIGTCLRISIFVRPVHLIECMQVTVRQLNECAVHFSETRLLAVKKRLKVEYATEVPDAEFYAVQYATSPDFIVSVDAQQKAYQKASVKDVTATIHSILTWKDAVCVYEGQKDVGLTWMNMGVM